MTQLYLNALASILPGGNRVDAFDRVIYDCLKVEGSLEGKTEQGIVDELLAALKADWLDRNTDSDGAGDVSTLILISATEKKLKLEGVELLWARSLAEAIQAAKSILSDSELTPAHPREGGGSFGNDGVSVLFGHGLLTTETGRSF